MRQLQPGLISVIMPVYNAEKTLKNSVESVLSQSYPDIELILIDDGSRDRSLDLCRAIAQADRRVRVLSQKNAGPAAARNAALATLRGEYVMFADSDDLLAPDACRRMVEAMGDKELVIAHYYFDLGKVSSPRGLLQGNRTLNETQFLLELMQRPGTFYFSALWNKLYRAELILERQLTFNPFLDWGEDFAFNMQYYHGIHNGVALVEKPVYHYIKKPGGTSIRSLVRVAHSCRIKSILYQEFKALYVEKGLFDAHRLTIQRYIYNVTLAD